jgi:hypothetical protein
MATLGVSVEEMSQLPSYKNLMLPDPQSKDWGNEHLYQEICKLELPEHVPAEIRSYFDTVRVLWLHGWYYYRFYDWVDLHARICVEFALKTRFNRENINLPENAGLKCCLLKAIKLKYLTDVSFTPTKTIAGEMLELELDLKKLDVEFNEVRELLKEEGVQVEVTGIKHKTLIDELAAQFPKIRNYKAHGADSSETPLRAMFAIELARGIIIQLFPSK